MTTLANAGRSYANKKTQDAGKFFKALRENFNNDKGAMLDSASVSDFMASADNLSGDITGFQLPDTIRAVRDELTPDQFSAVTRALLDSASIYEREHGHTVPPDVIEVALTQAWSTTRAAAARYSLPPSSILDSASSDASDPLALQSNRAVTSIISTVMSACPFALYMPFDIGSNQAKLAIVSHRAGFNTGQYALNESLDGANSGDVFMSSSRVDTGTRGTPSGAAVAYTGKLTRVQTTRDNCAPTAGNLKLLKGRALVFINGQRAASEVEPGVISGSITIGAITYTQSGTIDNDTGDYSITVTASSGGALAASVPVMVKGHIDFERDPSITPKISTHADTFLLHANPQRGTVDATPDSVSQMSNELGIDPISESLVSMQNHLINERHYEALFWCMKLAAQNAATHDFNWAGRAAHMVAAEAFNDMLPAIGRLSQKMAVDTMSYGIKYGYCGLRMAAMIQGLPSSIFEPSGISARPGVYRLGRLFGQYEIYYCPKVDIIPETASGSTILFIGQAFDAVRAPIVFGDAVAPIVRPLGVGSDMKTGFYRYERNFVEVNPHHPSSLGSARLDITNFSV